MVIDNANNPIVNFNRKLHDNTEYNLFQVGVTAIAVFTGGMTKTMPYPKGGIKAIPNVENATINPKKLTEYALNPDHPVGGNKAKVIERALGYNQSNADDLMRQIYDKLPNSEAVLGKLDEYGQRYTVDMPITARHRICRDRAADFHGSHEKHHGMSRM